MSEEDWRRLTDLQGDRLSGRQGFAERKEEGRGESAVQQLGYGYRGADTLVAEYLTLPRGEAWRMEAGEDTVEGRLLRAAVTDSALLPRLREGIRTLDWSVATGPALFLNDARRACEKAHSISGEAVRGRDRLGQLVDGSIAAVATQHAAAAARLEVMGLVAPESGHPASEAVERDKLAMRLREAEIGLIETGINVGVRQEVLGEYMKTLVLAGETVTSVRAGLTDKVKGAEVRARLNAKRTKIMAVERGMMGVGESAQFLYQLLSMQTDLDGIVKVFTGPDHNIPTHLLTFLSLSDHLNRATTIAFKELMRQAYPKFESGKLVTDSKLATSDHKFSLAAMKDCTPAQREKYFADWEGVVMTQLEAEGIGDEFQLAEDAVSLATFLSELLTLGGTAYPRDRITGKLIGKAAGGVDPGGEGSGSMYDFGGVDTVNKVHQLRDRKSGEAEKGRSAPRPGVIQGLSQELLFNMLQYSEATQSGKGMGISVLEAITRDTPAGGTEYTIRDLVENMTSGDHFSYMLYAFRACQISSKLDQLPAGRIEVIRQLGGGPEKLLTDMIDIMLGLNKAWQTIPFGSDRVRVHWMGYDEKGTDADKADKAKQYREGKTIEIRRNMVNLFADFYRGAVIGAPSSGGYEDNPDWRGIVDLLPQKVYERLVVYTNILTPQMYAMAIGLAKDDRLGGCLTDEIIYADTKEAEALRRVLLQDPRLSDESLINVIPVAGYAGTNDNVRESTARLVNSSADAVVHRKVIPDVQKERARRIKVKLTTQSDKV
ncbi:MAG: hypothetical protein WCT01_03540 [Candidatus Shapirobacteria bacterium]